MPSPPQAPAPTISPAEIQILVSRAGLVLNPGQVADLVLAWRQVAGLIGAMHRDRKVADDMALVFRLPPPTAEAASAGKPAADERTRKATPRRTDNPQPARAAKAAQPPPRRKEAAPAASKLGSGKAGPGKAAPGKATPGKTAAGKPPAKTKPAPRLAPAGGTTRRAPAKAKRR